MNKLRKNRRKGFTLVEIIVVLVIIAILMAALTPVMIGWINEARAGAMGAEARTCMMAVQAVAAENASKPTPIANTSFANLTGGKYDTLAGTATKDNLVAIIMDATDTNLVQGVYYKKGTAKTIRLYKSEIVETDVPAGTTIDGNTIYKKP